MKLLNDYILEKLIIDKDSGLTKNNVWYKFSSNTYDKLMEEFGDYTEKTESKTYKGTYIYFLNSRQILGFKESNKNHPLESNRYRMQEITYSDDIKKVIKWFIKTSGKPDEYWKHAKEKKFEDL